MISFMQSGETVRCGEAVRPSGFPPCRKRSFQASLGRHYRAAGRFASNGAYAPPPKRSKTRRRSLRAAADAKRPGFLRKLCCVSSALGGRASALASRDWQRYRVAYLGSTPPCKTVEPCAGIRDWRVHATSLEE